MAHVEALTATKPPLTPDRLDRPPADPLLARLFPPLPAGVEWELERSARALAALGGPQTTFRSIHVGGTNGKGSVTATVASVLRAAGHRTGTYTSPHLRSFRERVLVDGRPLGEETLVRYADDVRDAVERFGLTFFEAATVLAFHAFREEGVGVASVEVGLGGRLDATNVLRPEVTAVTNIAMDHAEFLGDTLVAIADEKAGIMKPGVPFVTAESDPSLLELFRARGGAVGAPVFVLASDAVTEVRVARHQTVFSMSTRSWGTLELVTPLVGRHQAVNTALAVEIFEHVPETLRPDAHTLLEGVRSVRHRGRDDVRVIDGRTWLFDVAHNAAGVASLADTLDRLDLPRPWVVLFGVLGDKDWRSMLPPLLWRAEVVVLTVPATAPAERRWDPAAAAEELRRRAAAGRGGESQGGGAGVRVVVELAAAAREAAELAGGGTVIVTGSVHTVGSTMGVLGLDPLA